MPYRKAVIKCTACSSARPATDEGGLCPECGGTGEVEQLYHYRGSVKISPEDGAMLDAILGKMYGYFSTAQVEESGDDDL